MKISNVKRIILEDYSKEEQELISKLALTLNPFMEEMVNFSNNKIDFDNLKQELITLKVIVDTSGTPSKDTKFATTVFSNSYGGHVIYAKNLTNGTIYPVSMPFVSFASVSDKLFKVNNISGLQAGNEYELKLVVYGK